MTPTLCFVDTETSSLLKPWLPGGRRTWETALIRRDADGFTHTLVLYTRLADEVVDDPANKVALDKGGYFERSPWATDTLPDFGPDVSVLTMSEQSGGHLIADACEGATIVGANARFDEDNLHWLAYHAKGEDWAEPKWEYHVLDVTASASGRSGMAPPYRSADVSLSVGVDRADFEPHHTALADARWAQAQYDAIYGKPRGLAL